MPAPIALPPASTEHVHILMGSFNGARWIEAQLDSFLAQSHPHWTLWISDDGSQDDTRALIDAFDRRHPGRLARCFNGPGRGSAANYLHLLCHPDLPAGIVALSDQDDVWHPHKLERALAQLRAAGPAPCAWAARYRISDAALTPRSVSSLWRRGPSLGNALVQNILSGHTLTLNPAALALVRRAGPRPVPHHDWWIYLVLMACGAEAIVDPEIVLDYRQHTANSIGERATLRARQSRLAALQSGQMGQWIAANLAALADCDLPLTANARSLARHWPGQTRIDRLRLMRQIAAHRQTPAETALIYLAAMSGRL